MSILRQMSTMAVEREARNRKLAQAYPWLFYLGELLRAAGVAALIVIFADAFSYEVFGTSAQGRIMSVFMFAAAMAARSSWRYRRRPLGSRKFDHQRR